VVALAALDRVNGAPMDKDTIQQIAAEVVARLPDTGYGWWPLVIQTVLMLLVAGGGAYFGSYFRTRGQNLATKHDFDKLQEQLKDTTLAVETIKSEVSQRDWAQREWTNLRRVKLEALMEKMHECEAFLRVQRRKALDGEPEVQEHDKWGELDTIGTLYFRELKNEVHNFVVKCVQQGLLNIKLWRESQKGNERTRSHRCPSEGR
jgi:hypothetical protein